MPVVKNTAPEEHHSLRILFVKNIVRDEHRSWIRPFVKITVLGEPCSRRENNFVWEEHRSWRPCSRRIPLRKMKEKNSETHTTLILGEEHWGKASKNPSKNKNVEDFHKWFLLKSTPKIPLFEGLSYNLKGLELFSKTNFESSWVSERLKIL